MKVAFYCEKCSKQLPVTNESLAGREIRCPYCRQTIRLTPTYEEEDAENDADLLSETPEEEETRMIATRTMATRTMPAPAQAHVPTPSQSPESQSLANQVETPKHAESASDFDLAGSVLIDAEQQATYESLVDRIPGFKPNPFGYSFPLEKYHPEGGVDDEEENARRDDSYDVDDLIVGVDRPDGNF